MWESNCLFVDRTVIDQIGAFDQRFDMPGGGYANLDLYERVGSTPGLRVVTILGEGSFHQVHGGTTTNQPDPDERLARLEGFRDHYRALRGREYHGTENMNLSYNPATGTNYAFSDVSRRPYPDFGILGIERMAGENCSRRASMAVPGITPVAVSETTHCRRRPAPVEGGAGRPRAV